MNLYEINNKDHMKKIPFAKNSLYKWHSIKRYPKLIIKVGGKLFFDMDEWECMARKARDKQVKENE